MPAYRPERLLAPRVLIVGCGALANELVALTRHLPNVDITCLPATLHNRPGGIPAAVRERIRRRRKGYDRVFVAYADCGTGGLLDPVIAEEGVERLAGAHCYEFYAGREAFEQLSAEEPGTFYLTDFLARNFDRLVIGALGLDRHPELRDAVLRQLPPARLPGPDRGSRAGRRRATGRPPSGPDVRAPPDRLRRAGHHDRGRRRGRSGAARRLSCCPSEER